MKEKSVVQNIPISKLNDQQIKQLHKINHFHFSKIGFGRSGLTEALKNKLYEGFGLCQNNEVVGYALYSVKRDVLILNWMAVSEQVKMQGIGKTIIGQVVQFAKSKKLKAIELDSRNIFKPAMRLYLRTGFDVIGTYLASEKELMIKFRREL